LRCRSHADKAGHHQEVTEQRNAQRAVWVMMICQRVQPV